MGEESIKANKITEYKRVKRLILLWSVAAVLLITGGVVTGTLAWLTAETDPVENVFTTSDIDVTLEESEDLDLKMIPGWTVKKDPKVSVTEGSEDCYLFVKIEGRNAQISKNEKGNSYSLGDYIVYAVADGWTPLGDEYANIFYRVVDATNEKGKLYDILGKGAYSDPMGTEATTDDVTVTWAVNQVATKPSVTKEMMASVTPGNQPTLSFTAYAVQLWETNGEKFTAEEAWQKISTNN